MAMTSFGPLWIHGPIGGQFGMQYTESGNISADGQAIGFVFRAPRTGTLDWAEFRMGNLFDAIDNGLRISFQDLDANGYPDNTADQYRVITSLTGFAWTTPPGVMTSDGTDGGSKRSVTAGDYLAVVVEFESFVAGDAWRGSAFNMWSNTSQARSNQNHMVTRSSDGTTWSDKSDCSVTIALRYDDGTYAYIGPWDYPMSALNTATYASNSTPDERGLVLTVPFACRVSGAWARVNLSAAADLVLYDGSDNVVVSSTLDASVALFAAPYSVVAPFAPTELAAGTYRLVLKPTTTSSVSLYDYDVSSNAHLAATEGGTSWYYTQRTDGGSWTDTDTKRPFMGLLFDGIDASGGGGGGQFSFAYLG